MNTQPGGLQNNPPQDQHTITECLLTRFTDTSTGKLKAYYLPRRRECDNPPSRAGRVKNYIKHDPRAHENYWNTEVENHLPTAFAAVDDGTILDQPDLVRVLKDCIALHWARSAAYKQAHEKLLQSVTEQQKRQWLENFKPALKRAFYLRYGLYPAGVEALKHINDLLHEVPEIVTSGEFFVGRVRHNFDFARNHFAGTHLEVARPPAGPPAHTPRPYAHASSGWGEAPVYRRIGNALFSAKPNNWSAVSATGCRANSPTCH